MELRAALCRQGLSCDREGRSRPGPGTQLPTPGSVCPPPTRRCAGMGCNRATASEPRSFPAPPPHQSTWSKHGLMLQVRGPSGLSGWKPDRLWGMGRGWLVGMGCSGEQTPAGTLPERVPILPPPPPTPRSPRTRSRAACGPPPAPGSHRPASQSGEEGRQTSHQRVRQAPRTPPQHPAPPPPCLLTHLLLLPQMSP